MYFITLKSLLELRQQICLDLTYECALVYSGLVLTSLNDNSLLGMIQLPVWSSFKHDGRELLRPSHMGVWRQ